MQNKDKKGLFAKMDSFFGVTKNGSSFKVEIIAGIATFLAMAYILLLIRTTFYGQLKLLMQDGHQSSSQLLLVQLLGHYLWRFLLKCL